MVTAALREGCRSAASQLGGPTMHQEGAMPVGPPLMI